MHDKNQQYLLKLLPLPALVEAAARMRADGRASEQLVLTREETGQPELAAFLVQGQHVRRYLDAIAAVDAELASEANRSSEVEF